MTNNVSSEYLSIHCMCVYRDLKESQEYVHEVGQEVYTRVINKL